MKKNIKPSKNKKIIFKSVLSALGLSAIITPNVLLYNLNQDFKTEKNKKTNLKNNLDLINSKLKNAEMTIKDLENENQLSNKNLEKLKKDLKEIQNLNKNINDNSELINRLLDDSIKQVNNLRTRIQQGDVGILWLNLLNKNITRLKEILEKKEV